VAEGWKSIKLKEFEHVVTGPSQSLLRVRGRAPRRGAADQRPTLVVAGPVEHRFAPLRTPEDRGGVLRVAYAVPTALVQSGAPCWLEFGDATRMQLPTPEEGTPRMRDGRVAAAEALSEPAPAPAVSSEAAELAQARDELAALGHRVAELERACDDDQRAAAANAAQAQARLQSTAQRAETAERELETAQARARTAQQQAESSEARAQNAEAEVAARIQSLERELADVAPAREALERDVAELRARQSRLEQDLDKSRDQLRLMISERDELSRQAAAFDAVAVKARERAAQAEAANERATATLRELQVWRGELERRLADTTSELAAAQARETDERELMRRRATRGED
jgi:DNA repair exonuclease SbcCD ATPase subunit